jgi:hypothetical protein
MAGSIWHLRRFSRTALAAAIVALSPAADAAAQGADSPFRSPGTRGVSFDVAALDQPGCPVHLTIEGLQRTGSGLTVAVRLSNLVDGAMTRQVLGAWVIAPDGTMRGYQGVTTERPLVDSETRVLDLRIRTVPVSPNDTVVVAVQEAVGDATWRRDVQDLRQQVRLALSLTSETPRGRAGESADRTFGRPHLRRP